MNPSTPNQPNQFGAPTLPPYQPNIPPQAAGTAAGQQQYYQQPAVQSAQPAATQAPQPTFQPPAPIVGQTPMPNYQQPAMQAYPAPVQPPTAPQATAPIVLPPKTNPNSTQNTLQIAEIRDGIVIMNDGTYRSVIMAKSINFDLMSQQEQEAVEYSYQGFLNSLYFPVQIFLRSQRVDLH